MKTSAILYAAAERLRDTGWTRSLYGPVVPGSVVAVDPTPTEGEVAPRCDVLTDDGRFWPKTHPLSMRRIVEAA